MSSASTNLLAPPAVSPWTIVYDSTNGLIGVVLYRGEPVGRIQSLEVHFDAERQFPVLKMEIAAPRMEWRNVQGPDLNVAPANDSVEEVGKD